MEPRTPKKENNMNTKILKGFAALALCGAVAATANADVTSANIVG